MVEAPVPATKKHSATSSGSHQRVAVGLCVCRDRARVYVVRAQRELILQVPLKVLERRVATIGRAEAALAKQMEAGVAREVGQRWRLPTPEAYVHMDEWSDEEGDVRTFCIPRRAEVAPPPGPKFAALDKIIAQIEAAA